MIGQSHGSLVNFLLPVPKAVEGYRRLNQEIRCTVYEENRIELRVQRLLRSYINKGKWIEPIASDAPWIPSGLHAMGVMGGLDTAATERR